MARAEAALEKHKREKPAEPVKLKPPPIDPATKRFVSDYEGLW
jgi:hypothetical protein